jgi:hypothetical protein
MTVEQLVAELLKHDQNKRVVVADTDGAGGHENIEFVDQRVDKGENVITIWFHH